MTHINACISYHDNCNITQHHETDCMKLQIWENRWRKVYVLVNMFILCHPNWSTSLFPSSWSFLMEKLLSLNKNTLAQHLSHAKIKQDWLPTHNQKTAPYSILDPCFTFSYIYIFINIGTGRLLWQRGLIANVKLPFFITAPLRGIPLHYM